MNLVGLRGGSSTIIGVIVWLIWVSSASSVPIDREIVFQEKKIVVIGDSLAEGLYSGLYRLAKKNEYISVQKKTKINTGLVRSDRHDWIGTAEKIATSKKYDIAVVSFGANDLVSFRFKKGPIHFGSREWPKYYAQRVSELIAQFIDGGMEVIWVGLPITNRKGFKKGYSVLNSIYLEQANVSNIRFIDTWSALSEDGKYDPFGVGPRGKRIQIRHNDGVHFTPQGYLTYAKIVADNFLPSGWQNEKSKSK